MKATHILATLVAATLPLAVISAEDSSKTETTDQKQEQSSDTTGMKGMMGKGQMMSNWKDQDAELLSRITVIGCHCGIPRFGLILGLTEFCIWPYRQVCQRFYPHLADRRTNIEAGLTSSRHWAIQADY